MAFLFFGQSPKVWTLRDTNMELWLDDEKKQTNKFNWKKKKRKTKRKGRCIYWTLTQRERERGGVRHPYAQGEENKVRKEKVLVILLLVLAYKSASTNNKTNNKESQTKFHHTPIKRQNTLTKVWTVKCVYTTVNSTVLYIIVRLDIYVCVRACPTCHLYFVP